MKTIHVGHVCASLFRVCWLRRFAASAVACAATAAFAQTVGISTVAGQAGSTGLVNNATGTSARFHHPAGLASDGTTIYIADKSNNAIRKLTIATSEVTTMATGFNVPGAVAIDSSGNAYVADSSNHAIKKVTPGGVVSVLAGSSGNLGSPASSATLAAARFNGPQGIAVNGAGTFVYVADTGNNVVRRIDVANDEVTVIVPVTGDFKPWGLALNAAGTTLYVVDYGRHAILSVTLSGNTVATVAGTLGTFGSTDSPALFRNPQALTVDSAGDLYVADTGNNTIRKISGSTVLTIAGSAGSIGTGNGLGTSARFQGPAGIVATGVNSLFIADTSNHTIRRAAPTSAPAITSGNSATFTVSSAGTHTVTATGSPAPTFSISSGSLPSFATLNATTGVISGTPTSASGSPFTFTIQASNGVGSAATQTFTLTVEQAPTITSGNSTTFSVNTAGSFQIVATGSPAPTFSYTGSFPSWATLNTSTGLITGTPPDNSGSPFNFTIIADNDVGSNATQAFTLTVNNGAGISSHPSNTTALVGTNAQFTVVGTGTPSPNYQWQREPASGGGFSNLAEGGKYTGTTSATLTVNSVTAAMNGDKFRVVVNNGVGSAVTSNTAVLTAAQVPAITSSSSATFVVNQSNLFTVTATGTPAPTFGITGGTFPSWASLNATTGAITGTPSDTSGSPYQFQITASNGVNPVATQNFTLTVSLADAAAAISTHPVDATVELGENATFTSAATGSPTPALRWHRQPSGTGGFVALSDDGTFSGTTTGTLTITDVAAGMTGDRYRLVATNTVGSVERTATSNSALLTVNIGTAITTFAGSAGAAGGTDGLGSAARFNTPASIGSDALGNFYVADAANHVIRKITSSGVVTTHAGLLGFQGNSDGLGSAARFNGPSAIAVDSIGNVYVADTFNHTIRLVSPSGNVTTLAGLAGTAGSADGTGGDARFSLPGGIAVDGAVTVYVADSGNHTIRRITFLGGVTTIAGTAGSQGSTDGTGSNARFRQPAGIAVANDGVLFVADMLNHTIRRISTSAEVTTFAGGAEVAGSTDANGTAARFNEPTDVGIDSSGNLYVADKSNHVVRKIATNADVTTLAGVAGLSGSTDGVGNMARFNQPFSLTVTANDNLYIADTRNHTIRRSGTTLAPGVQTQPQNRTVPAGGTTTFTVVGTGVPPPSYQWQRQAAGTFGFTNLANDTFYSGVNTATLTLSNVFTTSNGDKYRVVLSNGITPNAVSDEVTLTIGDAPSITSANSAVFRATEASSFTITGAGSPAPVFTATGLPSWLTINPVSGVMSGTPPVEAIGQHSFTIYASNGGSTSQSFTLTVTPALVAPSITTQPVGAIANQGQSATFSVVASGTAPLTYQWKRNGAPLNGATNASLTIPNVQPNDVGSYTVTVANTGGSATSGAVDLIVNSAPFFTVQPRTQAAQTGTTVSFTAQATGGAGISYQWRKNRTPIAGANSATLVLVGVSATDAAIYDVQATNSVATTTSSMAQLTIGTSALVPVITVQPAGRTVVAGTATTLNVAATGIPAPTYQWRKNGSDIAGAVGPSLNFANIQAGDAGSYQVVVTNSVGAVTSAAANISVLARSYAGIYFGNFSGNAGSFALYVREDNTGVFLSYLPAQAAPVMSLAVTVNDNGGFTFSQASVATSAVPGEPARAAALAPVLVNGTIADGVIAGGVVGGVVTSFTGARINDGATANVAGFYQAGASGNGLSVYTIVSPNGQALVVAQSGATSDGGLGAANASGAVTLATSRTTLSETISVANGTIGGSMAGAIVGIVTGGSDAAVTRQRLVNISTRARVGTGDAVAIAGFVIAGEESKPVLIRAVGPSLGAAPFNIPGALPSPKIDLFRGNTFVSANAGIAGDRAAIDAAGQQSGAFPLGAAGTDAAMIMTLAPGNYTAIVSSGTSASGIVLVEVYDLSGPSVGQKLLNISTRASTGANDDTLIAGFVVPAGASKRVLVRGVGPGLAAFNVTGFITQPTLSLFAGTSLVAQNTNWTTSADAAMITTSANQVGAFGLINNDSAVVVTLPPGNYTAQVTGPGTATGIALIEVYELP